MTDNDYGETLRSVTKELDTLDYKSVILDKNIAKVRRIYISSFPADERMPFPMMAAMSLLWNTRFLSFYDNDILCGMLYLASIGKTTFVMFFAVDENQRCKGYGSRILKTLSEIKPRNELILSIEPCEKSADNYEERISRKRFYLANGYRETGYMTRIAGQNQEILIKNGSFSRARFRRFFTLYSNLLICPKVWEISTER